VRIEFLVSGQYPGDGKPKPVAFPDPADVAVKIDWDSVFGIADAGRTQAGIGNDESGTA